MIWQLVVILVLVVVLVILQYWFKNYRKSKWSRADLKFCQQNWTRIEKMTDNRHQVVEADKLLDHMMRKRGFHGSVADNLKQHAKKFSDLENLWQAHKLRNKIAHELDYSLSRLAARNALNSFKRALKDLGLEL